MCRKLKYLVSFVSVLSLLGSASAALPKGWLSQDINTTGGSASEREGTFTVTGDGWDIWQSADAFHYVYEYLDGDGEITARVVSLSGPGTNSWAKAGVMIRETLDPGSKYAMMIITGGEGNGRAFHCRPTTGGGTFSSHGHSPTSAPPFWVKMKREGSKFTGYYSTNGTEWLQQPNGTGGDATTNPRDIDMGETVYIGLCLTSHQSGVMRTATFDNVTVVGNVFGQRKAYNPSPADGAVHPDTWVGLEWSAGAYTVSHDVYFGENLANVQAGTGDTFQGNQTTTNFVVGSARFPCLIPGTTYYWRVDEVKHQHLDSPWKGNVWSFMVPPRTAYNPGPPDGARFIDPNVTLSWGAGFGAKLHHVYFGDNFRDVDAGAGGTYKGPVGGTGYIPGPLVKDTVYYWRVDEFDGSATHKGDVWSFTTMRAGGGLQVDYYDGMNFENHVLTRIDPQINFNWGTRSPDPSISANHISVIWTGQIEVAFSEPYTFIANADHGCRLWLDGQLIIDAWRGENPPIEHRSQLVELSVGQRYPIQVEWYTDRDGATAQLFWESPRTSREIVPQFALSPPVKAFSPTPPNGATSVKHTPVLSWKPAHDAASHQVYFGDNVDDVNAGTAHTYKGQQPGTNWTPSPLELDKVYYWRVDEFDGRKTHKGDIWSFSTEFWPDVYTEGSSAYNTDSNIVSVGFFHGFDQRNYTNWAIPWPPLEGSDNWNGQVEFWKSQIKQVMAANIDVMYVLLIDDYPSHHYEQSRVNLFRALNELRADGYDVPRVVPWWCGSGRWLEGKEPYPDLSTTTGKEELVSFYIRWFDQYYSVNQDPYADDYIAVMNWGGADRPILSIYILGAFPNVSSFTRDDLESRLAREFGSTHPFFNNGIYMVTAYHPPTFGFCNEKMWICEDGGYYKEFTYNGITVAAVKPGYWDQNFRDPGNFLARDGGVHYKNAWNRVLANPSVDRIYITSWNETGEGSGIYAADPGPPYIRPDSNNSNTDTWSDTNDPFEYIKTTTAGARQFNEHPDYGSRILWHNIPSQMYPGEKRKVQVVVRNEGDLMWNNANNFRFGQKEFLIGEVLFGKNGQKRWTIDDEENEVSFYGGIFRGRPLRFIIDLVAPSEPGEYVTHWGMLQEGVMWFGEELVVTINVYYRGDPFVAWDPSPSEKATGVTRTPILCWTAGDRALMHDVYFGADQTVVADADMTTPGIYRGRQALTSYTPPEELESGETYYWRIDEYNTDATISKGRVWSFTVSDPLSKALDTSLSFTTRGSADWFSQTTTSRYDGDAAQSGDISDNQDSWMQTTVSGTGTVKFYWKVSSEEDFDFLEFYIDGLLQDRISGLVNWEQKTYTISTSGSHTLEWRYMKDGSNDYGSDCGWVDKVEWVTD